MIAITSEYAKAKGAERRFRSESASMAASGDVTRRHSRFGSAALGKDLRNRKFLSVAYAILLMAGIYAAAAEESETVGTSKPLAFHIPAQPLASALQAYGLTTGVQALYESNSAVGRWSSAVDGDFTPDAALKLLLTGTDLYVRYTRPGAITLARPFEDTVDSAPPASPLVTSDLSLGTLRVRGSGDVDNAARLQDYSQLVQADIQNALRKNAKTRYGSYRAVLDIWIDPSRSIERAELFRSTGDRERDAAVASALRGLVISQPPPTNMPQPVHLAIVVRSLQ